MTTILVQTPIPYLAIGIVIYIALANNRKSAINRIAYAYWEKLIILISIGFVVAIPIMSQFTILIWLTSNLAGITWCIWLAVIGYGKRVE